eukprot:TRINITY_DN5545_c1_g2_i1.p1 TRINITY_DN5545_c1_g2~~TRINITY_DN5545_c1_g2_i1.p1  ORF type:complete len:602 (-),score=-12.59 TRINITY_DN5545_c1_g2_i1:489-2294(-)
MIFFEDSLDSPTSATPVLNPKSIDDLPDDLLLEILKYVESQDTGRRAHLRAASLVSKRWLLAASLACKGLTLNGVKASRLRRLLSRFQSLSTLNLSFLFDCSEDTLTAIGQLGPGLREIHVPETCKTTDGSGLVSMASGCPRVSVLSMPGFKGPEQSLMAVGENMRRLEHLRLRSVANLTDGVVAHIARSCRRLQELDVSFTAVTDDALHAVGAHLPALTHLDLKHCKNISGKGIASVASGCPQLQMLHLGVVEVSDEGLVALGRFSKRLQELYLDYGAGQRELLSREAVAALAAGCRSLRVLSLRGSRQVDNGAVAGLSRGCPSLQVLDLHACDQVGDSGLHEIVTGCKQLRELVLTGTVVGPAGPATFAGGLPHLEILRLSGELISDAVVQSVAANCPRLTEIHLSNCHVGDSGLQQLLTACAHLRSVTLKASAELQGTGFAAVASGACQAMESLALTACGITDEGLQAITHACPNLHQLNLAGCAKLTGDGIASALPTCSALKELNLAGCAQFQKDDIVRFTRSCAHALRSIRVSRPHCPDDEYTLKRLHVGWQLPSWARPRVGYSASGRLSGGFSGSPGGFGSSSSSGSLGGFSRSF